MFVKVLSISLPQLNGVFDEVRRAYSQLRLADHQRESKLSEITQLFFGRALSGKSPDRLRTGLHPGPAFVRGISGLERFPGVGNREGFPRG